MKARDIVEGESFGRWLRHRRRELDLTQDELARQVGCARITIRKIEADQLRPSRQLAELLAEHLGITADERQHFLRFARKGEAEVIPAAELHSNLPHPISTFIGREREIAEIRRRIGIYRLVTLTGAGGCGKSRLAIETARQVLDSFPDGVWFVAFAPLSDARLVDQTVASALGVHEDAGRPLLETLCACLARKRLLLIFDNCEHLIEECAYSADTLLKSCPRLHILATSRDALSIEGEAQYYVPCLSLPQQGTSARVDKLDESEAVRLFVDRGALVQPGFDLTDANSGSIAQICRRLDGMPLAIELAAARTKVLSVQHIAERLDDRFNLLIGGSRTALPRHQTLRATIEWSHELLPEATRMLFRRLSVLVGGFSQEAAQAVCSDAQLQVASVLAELSRLVDHSLVELAQSGKEERYRMLETIRAFAAEKLQASGEEQRFRNHHLLYFTEWAEKLEPRLRGPDQIDGWDRMEIEHDNIRCAMEWSLSGGDSQLGLRLAGAEIWFWHPRGYYWEALKWLKSLLAGTPANQRTAARAKVLVAACIMAMNMYTPDPIDHWFAEALGIFRELDDKWWICYSLIMMGYHGLATDVYSARLLFEDSAAIAGEMHDEWMVGSALLGVGMAYGGLGGTRHEADYATARRMMEESLLHLRVAGDGIMIAHALRYMGRVAMAQHDFARAAALGEEALKLYSAGGNRANRAEVLSALPMALLGLGHCKRAADLSRESLVLADSMGDSWQIGDTLISMGRIAEAEGKGRRSAILLTSGEATLRSMGTSVAAFPWVLEAYEECMAKLKIQLGETEFGNALAEGKTMTVQQAVDFALGMQQLSSGEA